MIVWRRRAAALLGSAVLAVTGDAHAGEPPLRAPAQQLQAALHCQPDLRAGRKPVLLVHGTGLSGREQWRDPVDYVRVLNAAGHRTCYVNLPEKSLGDVQTNAEYVVAAVRAMSARARGRVALYGYSQGGLLVRWALTYWPDLRPHVSDAVSVATPDHGTNWASIKASVDFICRPYFGCPPAFWQMTIGSHLLRALNDGRDETPGTLRWTTIRSSTDDIVQPETGSHPTSALAGARNVLIQRVCPGRDRDHFDISYDSVALAVLLDALRHRSPVDRRRFPENVCAHPYAPGLDEQAVREYDKEQRDVLARRTASYSPQAKREPPVRPYANR